MGNLPFERTRYNPVQDVTPDEAEKNKRDLGKDRAAQQDPRGDDIPAPGGERQDD